MVEDVSIEAAEQNLKGLLAKLSLGESVTLSDEVGNPLALLVSLNQTPQQIRIPTNEKWLEAWKTLAQEISTEWQGTQSAVETLSEMRR